MQKDKTIDINEIVKIEQMPKVFSQLEIIGKYIDEQVKDIDTLECNEDNKNEVKRRRTEINNTLKLLDDKRKEIKNTLLEPYEIFNEKYEQECKGKLLSASEILKTKIDTIEEEQKQEKEDELRAFAEEWFISKRIEHIVTFENIGLNITLSASMKSLKDQIIEFCEKVFNDIKLIELEEYKDEIMFEYKNCLDFAKSKMLVVNRHSAIDTIKAQQEIKQEIENQEEKIVEQIDEIIAPIEVVKEKTMTVTFTITDTKENILKVREFMKKEGIKYE